MSAGLALLHLRHLSRPRSLQTLLRAPLALQDSRRHFQRPPETVPASQVPQLAPEPLAKALYPSPTNSGPASGRREHRCAFQRCAESIASDLGWNKEWTGPWHAAARIHSGAICASSASITGISSRIG